MRESRLHRDRWPRRGRFVRDKKLSRTVPITFDASDSATVPAFVDATIAQHGLPDGVVHLVYASSVDKRLEEILPEDFHNTFNRGLTPTFVLCTAPSPSG